MSDKKEISILELQLKPEIWQKDKINKKMENAARLYNDVRRYFLKQYNELTRTHSFKEKSDLINTLRDLTGNWTGDNNVQDFHKRRCEGYRLDKDENKDKKEKGLLAYGELKEEMLSDLEFLIKLRHLPISADIFLSELKAIRDKLTKSEKKEYTAQIKELYKERNSEYAQIGLTEFSVNAKVLEMGKYYYASLSSTVCSLSVAKPLWTAFEKLLYKNGDKVAFKRFEFSNSVASNNKSGIRFVEEDGKYYLLATNRRENTKPMKIRVSSPRNDYEKDMVSRKIKIARIIRRAEGTTEKSKYHYYLQLSVEGSPYIKKDENNNEIHVVGKDLVSMSIWRDTLYAVSDNKVKKFSLSNGGEAFELKRDSLNKRMEELRRKNNPDNFNEDGTIKKGIVVDGVKQRLTWHNSVEYRRLKMEKQDLERKHRVNRELLHRKIAYELLEMGSDFIFTKTSFKTNKPEWTGEEDKLSNSEYRKKKARRKSIIETAPYDLKQKINAKLSVYGIPEIKDVNIKDSLYWYRFDIDGQDQESLSKEYITILGKSCPFTAYRAFISRYYDEEKQQYNQKEIADNWDKFIENVINAL